ncbi:hypothetical protein J2752_001647 [Halarchaeum rubridurum]|uniref:DUF8131 domain-containing protein n=1 Tax=Halarchaeum rubridurum TaxID=489911 RepID=A0A830FM04_9EURY|nr:hypothetical protein [Halarchaeum rubridurum]MBP1954735.1 hypothetical protein [Halarchaeum rubridurum]GGM63466.1 hypothetical protein GCM10009017_11940 [Halarchaeum rubridurum]
MVDVPLHWLTVLVSLAAVPAAVYLSVNRDPVVALTFVNIALVAGLLYRCFAPGEERATAEHT